MSNYKDWIGHSEIDYYTAFIKAWIPFNAWYRHEYGKEKTDREIINEIKRRSRIKSKLKNYINNNGDQDNSFRSHLASLHVALSDTTIENDEKERIWFNELVVETNRENKIELIENRTKYFLARKDKGIRVEEIIVTVKNQNSDTIYNLKQTLYDLEEIKCHTDFNNLSDDRKRRLLSFYKDINPRKPISLILQEPKIEGSSKKGTANNFIEVGHISFINNDDLITKGVIEILYLLRCKLFHGEVERCEGTHRIYKHTYFLLEMLLEELK